MAVADPRKLYGTLEMDLPWLHKAPGATFGANKGKGGSPKYRLWTNDEILRWNPPFRIARQAHAWLWTTSEHMDIAKEWLRMRDWKVPGFMRVWVKPQPAMGFFTLNDIEYVVFGYRGAARFQEQTEIKKRLGYFPRNVIGPPPVKIHGSLYRYSPCYPAEDIHSSKPHEFYRETAVISPGPHLSLFQRTYRPGWDGAGNEYEEGPTVFA